MELIDVGPRSEVPRVSKEVTIELNGEQRRIRQLSEINLSISSPVESERGALVVQDEDAVVECTGPGNNDETTCSSEGDSVTSMQVGTATKNETGSGNGFYCAEDMDFR
ncbi:hypothetical protein V6N13_033858 [Hibiscus sabdariffa]